MVSKFIFDLKNSNRGITLVEVIVVVFITALFASIMIADFPRIQRQFSLSRASYRLAQNIRKVQDLGLSGARMTDDKDRHVAGYGIYFDLNAGFTKQYIMYGDSYLPIDSKYTNNGSDGDLILDTVNVDSEGGGVSIQRIDNVLSKETSINFSPPNPNINISTYCTSCGDESICGINAICIVLGLDTDPFATRTVLINKSGLIEVK